MAGKGVGGLMGRVLSDVADAIKAKGTQPNRVRM